jgi:hypothetical protein
MIYFYTPVQDDKALLELCTPPPIYKPGFGIAKASQASGDRRRCPRQVSRTRIAYQAGSFCGIERRVREINKEDSSEDLAERIVKPLRIQD